MPIYKASGSSRASRNRVRRLKSLVVNPLRSLFSSSIDSLTYATIGSIIIYDCRAKKLEGMRNNGLEVRNQRSSHHVFSHPGVDFEVSVPANRPIKPVYIRQFVGLIDKLNDRAVEHSPLK